MRLIIFSLILVMSLLMVPGRGTLAAEIGTDRGDLAPSFALADLSGKIISSNEYRGKIILLNFWSTLCAPCIAEMPALNSLHLALVDKGFHVLTVSIDSTVKPVQAFVTEKKISLPVLLDKDKAVFFDDFAGPSLPASYLIDRNGIIIETFSGPREWDSPDMVERFVKLLEKR